jgi:hypothetical protein
VIDPNEWLVFQNAWTEFTTKYPVLGYRPGMWQGHNFLRHFRDELCRRDAIRKAKGRHWVAHRARFIEAAFECATGRAQMVAAHVGEV